MNQTAIELNQKALTTLEFDKVLALLAEQAGCDGARERAAALLPARRLEEAQRLQDATAQACLLIGRKGSPPVYGVKDIRPSVERAEKGALLSPKELLRIGNVLRATRALPAYLEQEGGEVPLIADLFRPLSPQKTLEERIAQSFISEEELSDHASPELADIRRKINGASGRIKETLQRMIRSPAYQKYLQEPIVTLRGDRYVLPVRAEYRAEVPGLVHDTSGSGATCFIEPMAVVEANNELKLLRAREQDEIERILAELSAFVSQQSDPILLNYELIVEIDFVFSKARLSYSMGAYAPELSARGGIDLRRARHPLIPREAVVPIDIRLGGGVDTMVVTGPNTGGKTVTLKTLGLLHLMAASGLHLPAEAGSEVAVFANVFCDIGDEQSIEQSLSTFSSHMVNIIRILEVADAHSLVLLDELGAGTDPIEGAALATAILERLRAQGARVAATTHYAELKTYALNTEGVLNASCEFDLETLRPTYRLILGVPGRSNAFAISERLGMDPAVVARAAELTSSGAQAFEEVLAELENRRQQMERRLQEAAQERDRANRIRAELALEQERFRLQRDRELEQAAVESKRRVAMAREMYNRTIEELEALRRERDAADFGEKLDEARQRLRRQLRRASEELDPVLPKEQGDTVLPRALRVGDLVHIRTLDKRGEVLSPPDDRGNVALRVGIINTKAKLTDLTLVNEQPDLTERLTAARRGDKPVSSMKAELDLRGMNGDEGCLELDRYLDEAALHGLETAVIIHGKGTGALRAAVQEFLRGHPHVRSFRRGAFGEGEDGVTVVELR
ncbi:MAG: endonuclease MutS2 [Clostridiales bacterium]|nr:endonuclease MutS2 [Clostridiales bacterium]